MGPYVVLRLVEAGHRVTVFHRGTGEGPPLPEGVAHVHGDRRRLAEHRETLRRLQPEVVLDMVSFTQSDAEGLMETFRGVAGRVVAASSMDVYRAYDRMRGKDAGPPDPIPLGEDAPLRDRLYPYRNDDSPRAEDDPQQWMDDYDKILVERAVLGDPKLAGTVLRLPAVYGPGDGQHRLLGYVKRMDHRRPAILLEAGISRWCWSRGFVENVAAAIALAVTDPRAAGRTYNVADAPDFTELDWARKIAGALEWEGRFVIAPDGSLPDALAWWRGGSPQHHLVANTQRIRKELGFTEIVPLDRALRQAIEWERATPVEQISAGSFDYAQEDEVLTRLRPR